MCKEADELTIVCIEVIMGDADKNQVKQDFSDLISSASENVSTVTISSFLPDTTEAHLKGICSANDVETRHPSKMMVSIVLLAG